MLSQPWGQRRAAAHGGVIEASRLNQSKSTWKAPEIGETVCSMNWKDLSITRKFGLLYLFLVACLASFGIVVSYHVGEMRKGADRLLEETREHAIAQRMMGHLAVLDSLRIEEAALVEGDGLRLEMASKGVDSLLESFSLLIQPDLDPSRPEHEAQEERHIVDALKALSELKANLAGEGGSQQLVNSEPQLHAVRACINRFVEETREEVEHSDQDLEDSAHAARWLTLGMVLAISFLLCLSLALVYRTIIAPLRKLREGADRFGAGALKHRISLSQRDELGTLAKSFNAMADSIKETQGQLEERIASRTRELIRAGRLADIGILAAGVAHEINTPLASIAACAEGLGRRAKAARSEGARLDEDELDEYLQTITTEAYRAHRTTKQLLALSRQDHGEVVHVDLQLAMDQVETTVKPLLARKGIRLETSYQLGGLELKANAGELIQVLVNLILNAKDASPEGSAIRFRCQGRGERVIFEVQDQGCGIANEDLDRVFSPFYTTKAPGDGTGLGLSLVANIVEMRAGRISVVSEPESGTCFRVELPLNWNGLQ